MRTDPEIKLQRPRVVDVAMPTEVRAAPANSSALAIPKLVMASPKAIIIAAIPETYSWRLRFEATPGEDDIQTASVVARPRRTSLRRSHDIYAAIPKATLGKS